MSALSSSGVVGARRVECEQSWDCEKVRGSAPLASSFLHPAPSLASLFPHFHATSPFSPQLSFSALPPPTQHCLFKLRRSALLLRPSPLHQPLHLPTMIQATLEKKAAERRQQQLSSHPDGTLLPNLLAPSPRLASQQRHYLAPPASDIPLLPSAVHRSTRPSAFSVFRPPTATQRMTVDLSPVAREGQQLQGPTTAQLVAEAPGQVAREDGDAPPAPRPRLSLPPPPSRAVQNAETAPSFFFSGR